MEIELENAGVHDQEFSHIQFSVTPWTTVCQASLSRQEYWTGLPFPSPGDLPDPGVEPVSLASPEFFTTEIYY